MTLPIRSVKVWINAFIPRSIAGLTRAVPAGPQRGQTMIEGPLFGWLGCYLTDQRSFSNSISAKSRMHSEVRVDVTGNVPSITQLHKCDTTVEVHCSTGSVRKTATGVIRGRLFTLASKGPPVRIAYECASSNPCWRGSPDIDDEGSIVIDLRPRTISVEGKVDDFPAFEMYAAMNDGIAKTLFTVMPLPGHTPFNLIGRATKWVTGRATF